MDRADRDVLTHAAPRELFRDVAALQGGVSDLAFDVVSLTKAPLTSVEPALTAFLGDLTNFYAAAGRGGAAAADAATAAGLAGLRALIGSADDPQHTDLTRLNADVAAAARPVVAHTAALLSGDASGAITSVAQFGLLLPAVLVDLVGGEPGGLVG